MKKLMLAGLCIVVFGCSNSDSNNNNGTNNGTNNGNNGTGGTNNQTVADNKITEELAEARQLWMTAGITDYSYRYEGTGFMSVSADVVVRESAVVSVTNAETGAEIAVDPKWTVEGLFDRIEMEVSFDAMITWTFDSTNGVPKEAYFDLGEEGQGFDVLEFMVD